MPSIYGTSCTSGIDNNGSGSTLPDGTQQTERLLWDVPLGEWIIDQGQAILGRNVVDDLQNSVVIGANININNERSICIGEDISGIGENGICLNTGAPITSLNTNQIQIQTDTVKLNINNAGTGTIPQLLGTINSSDYLPQSMTSLFDKAYPATSNGTYLYWSTTTNNWVLGTNTIILGANAGLGSLSGASSVFIGQSSGFNPAGATYLNQNTFIGTASGVGSDPATVFDNCTVIGSNAGCGGGQSSVCIGNSTGEKSLGIGSVCIGSLNQQVGTKSTAIGYRLGYDVAQGNVGFPIGDSSIVMGADIYAPVNFGSILFNSSNSVLNTTPPQGSINLLAFNSSLKLEGTNINIPTSTAGNYVLGTTDGINYAPIAPSVGQLDFSNITDESLVYGSPALYTLDGIITKGQPVMLSGTKVKALDATGIVLGIATQSGVNNDTIGVLKYGFSNVKASVIVSQAPDLSVVGTDFLMFVANVTDGAPATDDGRTISLDNTRTTCKVYDDGGPLADYGNSLSGSFVIDAGSGRKIYLDPTEYEFEMSGSGTLFDNLSIEYSTDNITWNPLNVSVAPTLVPYLYYDNVVPTTRGTRTITAGDFGGVAGEAFVFPDESINPDNLGNDPTPSIGVWHLIDARYVRFQFYSDSSSTRKGWDISIARSTIATPTPVIGEGLYVNPTDYTQLTNDDTLGGVRVATVASTTILTGEVFANINI
jgi:hypothetical protein